MKAEVASYITINITSGLLSCSFIIDGLSSIQVDEWKLFLDMVISNKERGSPLCEDFIQCHNSNGTFSIRIDDDLIVFTGSKYESEVGGTVYLRVPKRCCISAFKTIMASL